MVRQEDWAIKRTYTTPPLPHSLPHHLRLPPSQDVKNSVHPQHPQEPSCKAMKMSWLCLSAALLVLLVSLVDSTPVLRNNIQDQGGMSGLSSPLQAPGNDGGRWEGERSCCQPSLISSGVWGRGFCYFGAGCIGLPQEMRTFSSSGLCFLVVACELLIGVASLVAKQGL